MIFMVPDSLFLTHRHEKSTRWNTRGTGAAKLKRQTRNNYPNMSGARLSSAAVTHPWSLTGRQRNLSATADGPNPKFAASPFFDVGGSLCHGNQVCSHLLCKFSARTRALVWLESCLGVKYRLHQHSRGGRPEGPADWWASHQWGRLVGDWLTPNNCICLEHQRHVFSTRC